MAIVEARRWPHRKCIDGGCERDADDDEDEVGDGEADDEDVRGVARLVAQRHGDDEQVPDETSTSVTLR